MTEEVVLTQSQGDSPEPLVEVHPPAKPAAAADAQKTAIPATTDETVTPDATETPEQVEVKKESRRARKLEREKTLRIQAETENRLLREQIAKAEAKPTAEPDSGEPKRDEFEDYESYLRAVTKYDAKQEAAATLKAEREARQGTEAQRQAQAGQDATSKAWIEREKAFISTVKDYEEIVTPYVEGDLGRLSDGARRLIVDSEAGPQLLHHLATHEDVAERIAELPPIRQIVELGKLEDSLEKPVAKKASSAPAPVKPVAQGRSNSDGLSEKDSQTEYEAKRKAQGARWAR